jgi:hypothetical protein
MPRARTPRPESIDAIAARGFRDLMRHVTTLLTAGAPVDEIITIVHQEHPVSQPHETRRLIEGAHALFGEIMAAHWRSQAARTRPHKEAGS